MSRCIVSTLNGRQCKNRGDLDWVCSVHKSSKNGNLFKVFLPKLNTPISSEILKTHSERLKCTAHFSEGAWRITMPKDTAAPPPPKTTQQQALFLGEAQPTHRKSVVDSVIKTIDYLKEKVHFSGDDKLKWFTHLMFDIINCVHSNVASEISKREKALKLLIKYASGHTVDYAGVGTVITNEVDAYSISSRDLLLYVYKRAVDIALENAAIEATKKNIVDPVKCSELNRTYIFEFISNFMSCLSDELISSDGMCAAGRITRIVSALAGFDPDIVVGVSASEMMQSRMTVILEAARKKGNEGSIEYNTYVLEHIYNALTESGMPETDWQAWIDPFVT